MKNRKPLRFYLGFCIVMIILSPRINYSQTTDQIDEFKKINNSYYGGNGSNVSPKVQFTAYALLHGGYGFSIAPGFAYKTNWWQFSFNSSFNLSLGTNNIGNSGPSPKSALVHKKNYALFTVIYSPIITAKFKSSKNYSIYEEINPMYFGNASAISNNFYNAFSLGTNFVTMPKGKKSNIMTPRNRSQQLLYFQIKSGSVLINVIEDFLLLTDCFPLQSLADNRDRYYTGAGNLQVRFHNYYKINYYTETYTGTSYPDYQDYPDIGSPNWRPYLRRKKRTYWKEKFAYQDPGQKEFNNSRNLFVLDIPILVNSSNSPLNGLSKLQVYYGWAGGFVNGFQQHFIHNVCKIDRNTTLINSNGRKDQLHHFDYKIPPHDTGRNIFGIGTSINGF